MYEYFIRNTVNSISILIKLNLTTFIFEYLFSYKIPLLTYKNL